jgi:predicted nucleotidyltransferase
VTSAEIIEEIRVRISQAAPPDSRVILFGSRARGEADDGSDFDVLVIEPEVRDSAGEAVRLRRELRDLLAPIDVVVVDRETARRRAAVGGPWLSGRFVRAACESRSRGCTWRLKSRG